MIIVAVLRVNNIQEKKVVHFTIIIIIVTSSAHNSRQREWANGAITETKGNVGEKQEVFFLLLLPLYFRLSLPSLFFQKEKRNMTWRGRRYENEREWKLKSLRVATHMEHAHISFILPQRWENISRKEKFAVYNKKWGKRWVYFFLTCMSVLTNIFTFNATSHLMHIPVFHNGFKRKAYNVESKKKK